MKKPLLHTFLLALVLYSFSAGAEPYVELSLAQMSVDTPAASTYPTLADLRLGYAIIDHQIEIALMTTIDKDSLNQLTVDVPQVASVLYHYIPRLNSTLQLHLILGASQVNIKSSYAGNAGTDDNFNGISFGLGLEESFRSIPQLKLSLDWIQLYRGEDLHISTSSLGFHYEF